VKSAAKPLLMETWLVGYIDSL